MTPLPLLLFPVSEFADSDRLLILQRVLKEGKGWLFTHCRSGFTQLEALLQ